MSKAEAYSSSSTSNKSTSKSSNFKKSKSKALAVALNFSSCMASSNFFGGVTINRLLIISNSKSSNTGFKGLLSEALTEVA